MVAVKIIYCNKGEDMSVLFENAKIIAFENNSYKVLENAYLGVDGKYIDYIGTQRPQKEYSEKKNMYNKLLMPGLVNAHAHASMNLIKGVGNALPLMDWLHIMWEIEDRLIAEDCISGQNMAVLEMLSGGTTSFSNMYMFPLSTHKCVEDSGIKANICRVIMNGEDCTDYREFFKIKEAIELYEKYNGAFDDRLHVDWCVHAEYTIAETISQGWAQEVRSRGGRLHIHLSETQTEQKECIERHGKTPAAWFEELGYFDIPTYAAHCIWVTDEDLNILKRHGVSVVHTPTSNLKLGSGFARVPDMLKCGINVALGTDGSASNNNVNMFEEMHLTSVMHNGHKLDPTAMKPEDVIRMATLNGAVSQGRMDTGVLETGKKADIIAIDLDKPHMVPDLDTMALVVYSAQASDVCMTMVDGKVLYENGQYLTMDREKIFYQFKKAVERLY